MSEKLKTIGEIKGAWAEEIMASSDEPAPHVVQDVFPTGLVVLAGPPKAAKTILSFQAAICVVKGQSLFGKFPTTPGRVLYIALEEFKDLTKSRLTTMLDGSPLPPHSLRIEYNWPTMSKGGVIHIGNFLHTFPDTRLVVVDVLQRFKGHAKRGSYSLDYEEMAKLQRLANHFGVAVVNLHHTTKKIPANWQAGLYGTQGLAGVADTSLLLERPDMGETGRLCVTGRKCATRELTMRFDADSLRWHYVDEAQPAGSPERQAILEALAERRGPVAPNDLAKETGLGNRSVFNMVVKLVAQGLVTKLRRGFYMITDEGMASLRR